MKKPLYKVPSMAEIEALPWNGFKVASTFSGGGGSCLGYRMAGYRVVYANEFIPEAQTTYKNNHPNSFLDTRDIRRVQAEDVLNKACVDVGELDIFDGSPPCSAFSTAGKRERGWGEVKKYSDSEQRVDDLFYEYVRLLRGIQPKVFVAENVTGLVKGTAKGYFKRIMAALRECGYTVSCKILDSQWLGVPQKRQRTIFVGVRNDLKKEPVHPTPLPYRYSIEDALQNVSAPGENEWRTLAADTKTAKYWRETIPGHNFADACMRDVGKGSFFNMTKLDPMKTAPTITATCQQFHWAEFRYLTIPELKRVSGFPDDFLLTGEFLQRWERCGRAVPPLMMCEVAKAIETGVLRCAA